MTPHSEHSRVLTVFTRRRFPSISSSWCSVAIISLPQRRHNVMVYLLSMHSLPLVHQIYMCITVHSAALSTSTQHECDGYCSHSYYYDVALPRTRRARCFHMIGDIKYQCKYFDTCGEYVWRRPFSKPPFSCVLCKQRKTKENDEIRKARKAGPTV